MLAVASYIKALLIQMLIFKAVIIMTDPTECQLSWIGSLARIIALHIVQRLKTITFTCSMTIRIFCCVCGIHWRKIANSCETVVASSQSSDWHPEHFTSKNDLSSFLHAAHKGPSVGGWTTGLRGGNCALSTEFPLTWSTSMPSVLICDSRNEPWE